MNKKKVLSSILAAALVLGSTTAFAQENGAPSGTETVTVTIEPVNSYGDKYSDGVLKYTELDYGTYEVSGVKDRTVTEITIPTEVNGKRVTSIGENAFFGYNKLRSVTIPDGVTNIGVGAFFGCGSLTSVTIPDSVTNIDNIAFYGCSSLTSVTIPKSVTSIGNEAFFRCSRLTSVAIPDSVTNIGSGAFSICERLSAIDVDTGNSAYCSIDGVLFNKSKTFLIQYPAGNKRTNYIIPDSVTSIGKGAFYGCHELTLVTIPDSVTSIGEDAFYDCDGLTSVTIPDSVTRIGGGAFGVCYGVSAIDVDVDNSAYCSIDGVLFNKSKTFLVQYPAGNKRTSYIIPGSVTSIGDRAFAGCRLTSVTIPDSVTSIGDYAFIGCSRLMSVTIPDSVTSIEGAFFGCSGLTSVVIPDSVTNIGSYSFYACKNLKDVYYAGTEEQWRVIRVEYENEDLTSATIHFNSTGPVGTPVEVTVKTPEGMDISGQTATATVNGETKPLTITNGMLDVSGLADGKYTFTFKANNCAPRAYEVTVSGGAATGLESGVKLNLYGDINGDGKLTLGDVLKANASARNSKPLTGYDKSVADINEDGKISLGDVLKMNAHARNSKLLW